MALRPLAPTRSRGRESMMLSLRAACLVAAAVPAVLCGSPRPELRGSGISYRVKLVLRGEKLPVETRFLLVPTPTAMTRSHAKKSRMGGWRLEAAYQKDAAYPQAMVLARIERMLYLAGPVPQAVPRNVVLRFGDRSCPLWQLPAPKGVHLYAYLVEVSPGLLALSYLSGTFASGEVASVEIQMESFRLDRSVLPAEDGTALWTTLRRMSVPGGGPDSLEDAGEVIVTN